MLDRLTSWLKVDAIRMSEQIADKIPAGLPISREGARRRMLDILLNVGIPFNRWLGLRIEDFSPERVTIVSPPSILRQNHVGTAHACAQALIGEYAAGLVVAQHFAIEKYRIIIGKLEIDYAKAGRGTLKGTAEAPEAWPELEEEEGWVEMQTRLTNETGTEIAVCRTRWQIKSWARIEADRKAYAKN